MGDDMDEPNRGAFASDDGIASTQLAIVAFVDFLGFSNLVRIAAEESRDDELLADVRQFVLGWKEALRDRYSALPDRRRAWEATFFSDNLAVAHPIRMDVDPEMGSLLGSLELLQIDAIVNGFFLRGAIGVGKAYVDDDIVFGVPFIEAVEAEKRAANTPRIVFASSARSLIAERIGPIRPGRRSIYYERIIRDEDGQWFLNYLDACFVNGYTEPPEFTWVAKHREAIASRLKTYQADPHILAKYEWVARYHNWWCAGWGGSTFEVAGHEPLHVARLSDETPAG